MTKYIFSNGKVSVEPDAILEPETRRRHVLRPGIIVVNTLLPAGPESKWKKPDEQEENKQQDAA